METINLATSDGIKTIEAEEIFIKGYDELRLFIHPTLAYLPEEIADVEDWTVTEFTTGMTMCNLPTKEECITQVNKRVKQYSAEKIIGFGLNILNDRGIEYPVNK